MEKDKASRAVAYTHRLLGVRPRSERELRDRLFKKGFDSATIHSVIASLKEKNIIDDFKFAKLWVESRMHINPKGDMLLQKELREKGIAFSIIEKVLSEKKEKEDSVAKTLARERLERLKKLPKEKVKKKIFDFLARRGFDFDIIEEVIREISNKG